MNEQGDLISKSELLKRLIERKHQNIEAGVGYICGIGINQAIGIINRMPTIKENEKDDNKKG